jgi:hypothetical protein
LTGVHHKAAHRQRIQYLIREQHTAQGLFWRTVKPPHAGLQMGNPLREGFCLPCLQICARLEDQVLLRQGIEAFQFQQDICRHDAGTCTGFDDAPAAKAFEHLCALARNTL